MNKSKKETALWILLSCVTFAFGHGPLGLFCFFLGLFGLQAIYASTWRPLRRCLLVDWNLRTDESAEAKNFVLILGTDLLN